MLEEFADAENLLLRAGLLETKMPVKLEAVMEYLAKDGLQLYYYNPRQAPEPIKSIAASIDEVLVYGDKGAVLFVNGSRPLKRQRFSIFHGIGHFLLPGHRGLNYLARGCETNNPVTNKPYERQADYFAAALNMPPRRYRQGMALLPFGMQTVEMLAERYKASIESAAIHYVNLADAPCALVRLGREYQGQGPGGPEFKLKVRYQVSSASFLSRIKPGTAIPADSELFWRCSQEEYLAEGVIEGNDLGLKPETRFWVDCLPYDHIGTVLALVSPGNRKPREVIDPSQTV